MLSHLAVSRKPSLPKLAVWLCVLLFVVSPVAGVIAADPPAGRHCPCDRQWTAPADRRRLADLYHVLSAPGDREAITKEAPVVVLLHGDKQNRLVYEVRTVWLPVCRKGARRDHG